ncbi:MAG: hypothetical protein AAB358_02390 [Patescibacteria group bacterium]
MDPGTALLNGSPLPQAIDSQGPLGYWEVPLAQPIQQFTLTISVVGEGIVNDVAGVYDAGTEVTVTADPDDGWQFDHWEGDTSSTANPVTITMNANRFVRAVFVEIPSGTAPTITSQPQSITRNVGQSATFSVSASGSSPLSYQWQKRILSDWVSVFDGASPIYTISSVTTGDAAGDAGDYRVKVTNPFGEVISNVATLTVNPANFGEPRAEFVHSSGSSTMTFDIWTDNRPLADLIAPASNLPSWADYDDVAAVGVAFWVGPPVYEDHPATISRENFSTTITLTGSGGGGSINFANTDARCVPYVVIGGNRYFINTSVVVGTLNGVVMTKDDGDNYDYTH